MIKFILNSKKRKLICGYKNHKSDTLRVRDWLQTGTRELTGVIDYLDRFWVTRVNVLSKLIEIHA